MRDPIRCLALALIATLAACSGPAPAPQRTLTVDTIGTGRVTSSPAGVDCGGACQSSFAEGATVTLSATPQVDFVAWTGCDARLGTTCTVTMSRDRLVTASFTGAITGTLVFPGDIGGPSANVGGFAVSHELRGTGRGVEFVPGEVLIRFAPHVVRSFATLQVDGVALERARGMAGGALGLYRAAGLAPSETLALVASLRARADVLEAFPNWVLHAFATPDDVYHPFQWHYAASNLPNAWDIETGAGAATVVAVVDTGIIQHPDLTANLLGRLRLRRSRSRSHRRGWRDRLPRHPRGRYRGGRHEQRFGRRRRQLGRPQVVPVRVIGSAGSGTSVDILDGIIWAAGNPGERT
jgi:serine protease